MRTSTNAPSAAAAVHTEAPTPSGPAGDAAGAIMFPQGLPGFPDATRFALRPAPGSELLLLESADDPQLRLLVLPYADRKLPLSPADLDLACGELGIRPEEAAVLLVVTRRCDPGPGGDRRTAYYVNLRAPLFVDPLRRTATQHVLASPAYPVRHLLQAA